MTDLEKLKLQYEFLEDHYLVQQQKMDKVVERVEFLSEQLARLADILVELAKLIAATKVK